MALCNGPNYIDSNPNTYTANIDLSAQGDSGTTLFNTLLSDANNTVLPFNTGYHNEFLQAYSANFADVNILERDIKVANVGNLTIFNQVNEEVQQNLVPRGANMTRNYGFNSFGSNPYLVQGFTYDVTKNTVNCRPLHYFFNTYNSAVSSGWKQRKIVIIKRDTLNQNIRNSINFPDHFQPTPFPGSKYLLFLDLSSLSSLSTAQKQLFAQHLSRMITHYSDGTTNFTYVVDMSNTIEETITVAAGAMIEISWRNGTSSPIVARVLDDTLTRQDIRFGLFLIAKPLPRFMDTNSLNVAQGPNQPRLDAQLPYPDNREVLLKWFTKTDSSNNEYTISAMTADPVKALQMIRDIRICKTFLYQVGLYIHKVSFIPDSNTMFNKQRFENLIGGNLVGFGDYYMTCLADTTTKWAKWIAWIPYELAYSTNQSVKYDNVKWGPSQKGRMIANIAKRSRSLMIPKTTTTVVTTEWYNRNDDPNIGQGNINPITATTNLSSTRRLTVNAYPISMHWDAVHFPIFSTKEDETYLVKSVYLEDNSYFPDYATEESWN